MVKEKIVKEWFAKGQGDLDDAEFLFNNSWIYEKRIIAGAHTNKKSY